MYAYRKQKTRKRINDVRHVCSLTSALNDWPESTFFLQANFNYTIKFGYLC